MFGPEPRSFPLAGNARRDQLLLTGIVAALAAWHLWAVLVDQRFSGSDTTIPGPITLKWALESEMFVNWLAHNGPKGPMPALLSLPLLYLVGLPVVAARLLSVFCHLALVLQAYSLARHLSRSRDAGLWAALLVAVNPLLVGWCRLAFQEPPLAVAILGVLQCCLMLRFDRHRHWILLGLLSSAALLTKLSALVFLLLPIPWVMFRRVRGVRGVTGLALSGVTVALCCGPWLVLNFSDIMTNFFMSRHTDIAAWVKLRDYLTLPGVGLVFLGAVVVAADALIRRRPDRGGVLLLFAFVSVSLGMFFGVFDYWSRYIVPLLAPLAVLCGIGLHRAACGVVPVRWLGPAGGLMTALLVVWAAATSLGWVHRALPGMIREHYSGMLVPDGRPHVGFPRAVHSVRGGQNLIFVLRDSSFAAHRSEGIEMIWQYRGLRFNGGELANLKRELREQGRVELIMIRAAVDSGVDVENDRVLWIGPVDEQDKNEGRELAAFLTTHRQKRLMFRAADPDGLTYEGWILRKP